MSIYKYLDYRPWIRDEIKRKKAQSPRFTLSRLAAAARVQAPYLSKILKGEAEFTMDQAYLAADFFRLDKDKREYLLLLVDHSRSQLKTRKQELAKNIQQIQAKYFDTKEHLESTEVALAGIEDYYLDPFHQVIHTALALSRYQSDTRALAQDLGIDSESFYARLNRLVEMGLIEEVSGAYQPVKRRLHLDKNSSTYPIWRNQTRLLGYGRLQITPRDQAYNFSVFFTTNPSTRLKAQALFLEYIKQVQELHKGESPENLMQLNFDLIPWV